MKLFTWLTLLLAASACVLFFVERGQRNSLQEELAALQQAFAEIEDACEIRVAELRYQYERVRQMPGLLKPAPRLAEIQQNLQERRHALRDQALSELVVMLRLDPLEAEQFVVILRALEHEQRQLLSETRVSEADFGDEYQLAATALRRQALFALMDLLGPGHLDLVLNSRLANRLGLRAAEPVHSGLDSES